MIVTNGKDAGGQDVLMPKDQEIYMIAETLWMWSRRKQILIKKKQVDTIKIQIEIQILIEN